MSEQPLHASELGRAGAGIQAAADREEIENLKDRLALAQADNKELREEWLPQYQKERDELRRENERLWQRHDIVLETAQGLLKLNREHKAELTRLTERHDVIAQENKRLREAQDHPTREQIRIEIMTALRRHSPIYEEDQIAETDAAMKRLGFKEHPEQEGEGS